MLAGLEHMTLGESSATIAILEFSDYECPYCSKHYQNVLPKLRERYIDTGIVKYVIKDFPLEFHANAKKASLATRCAGEQGHYWQMHNAIFDMHGQVSDALIDTTVKQLKLNNQIFKHCLANPKHIVAIEKDIALGASLGVNGTPAFVIGVIKNNQLINYKRFDGVQSFETFATMIDSFKKQ
ncbi:MAG: thioredoxin domain-containing protein [Methylococcales bacterium]